MVCFFNIVTFVITTIIALKSFNRIISQNYSALHLSIIIYYAMQCLPIFFELIYGLEFTINISPIFYRAMKDDNVAYIYDILTILSSFVLYKYANKFRQNNNRLFSLKNIECAKWVNFVVLLGMFLPIFLAIFLSPNPEIYFEYAYFYKIDSSIDSLSRIYHIEVVSKFLITSFLFTVFRYYTKKNIRFSNCIDVYLSIFLITWINQKRTLMIFLLFSILVIDFLKKNNSSIHNLLKKSVCFLLIITAYFVFYSYYVKPSDSDFMTTYTLYFSRLNVEKVALYDILYDNKLLEYKGQSLLYNLLFFVPRYLWPSKPAMYTKSFTAYVESGYGSESYWFPYNLQVNIWGDWVSSLGIIGHIAALFFIIYIIKIAENSNNNITKISGITFVLMYLMFGFEGTVIYIFILWITSIVYLYKITKGKLR